ncbi:MAG: hypothetical protein IT443_13930 [Phycisphaeraceae bacterium]|nr:hypothetical protein [Phycisphaeraceae bacterium]
MSTTRRQTPSPATAREYPSVPLSSQVRQVILLAGAIRPTPLTADIGRSMLDMPITSTSRLISIWQKQLDSLADFLQQPDLSCRILVDQNTPLPNPPAPGRARLTVAQDPQPFRGTAGVLRDVVDGSDPSAYVLVVEATQLPIEPLPDSCANMLKIPADVVLLSHRQGIPAGLMLIRCGTLQMVPTVGFLDLKEQILPRLASEFVVRAIHLDQPVALPLRTLPDYIHALRLMAGSTPTGNLDDNPFEESWRTAFSIVEPDAMVASSARIHDSVVLAGGTVNPHAVLVNSVVGPGGVVPAGQTIINEVVGATRRKSA